MTDLIDRRALDLEFTKLRFNKDGTLHHWGDRPEWCLCGQEVEEIEADGTYKMQWVTFDAWKPFYTIKDVIAWMPLPEPYKGEP